jgi:hypothetical protein
MIPAVRSSGALFGGGIYSLAVERYCGGYDGADCHKESTSVTEARATIADAADDVEALSSSLPILSSGTEPCDVIVPPESSGNTELNRSDPRLECGIFATSVDIYVLNQRVTPSIVGRNAQKRG